MMSMVGEPAIFAIEWQVLAKIFVEVFGYFCFWVAGKRLGKTLLTLAIY